MYGSFSGNPKTEWLTDSNDGDRDMLLLEDFWYDDPDEKRWMAPVGSVINGAGIPRPLWATIGSPVAIQQLPARVPTKCSTTPAWPVGVQRCRHVFYTRAYVYGPEPTCG
ncbi:hypothetical protein GSbR_07600 [Geobacter sp. SVR]|nr:hypothetical protein GSVR_19510 [Geobacter sp. SVR]GCF84160.1 hypothetical protein GSbR_07600 [Geobacter sp. SVR]